MKIKILEHEMEFNQSEINVINELAEHHKINPEQVIFLGISVLYTVLHRDPEANRVITGINGISIPLKLRGD